MNLNLKPYEFSNNDLKEFEEQYSLVINNVILSKLNRETLNKIPDEYGVYFWLMEHEESKYKIYIGKTNSLRRRVKDYTLNFQIHSPNDYKLQFFQNYINKHLTDAVFNLYFMKCDKSEYSNKETESIRIFKPIINERIKPSEEMKSNLKNAFDEYYNEVFSNKLNT